MKKNYFIILCILFFSCARAPEPKAVVPERNLLQTPEEFNRIGLSLKRKYESGSELFNFFFWPSNLDRESLKELSTDVAEIGIQIEEKYKTVDEISFKKSKIDKKIKELEEEKDNKILELFKNYGCIKNEAGDACVAGNLTEQIYPESCEELGSSPWNSEDHKKECSGKEEAINQEFEKSSIVFEEQLSVFEEEIEKELVYITTRADAITDLLENNNKKSEEWINWMQTKEANIVFVNDLPQITLKIMFNNNLEGVANRYLYYKSKDSADISDIRFYIERLIPVLEFTMFEKRATRVNGINAEEKTGVFYKMKLRQTELDYGLEYLGDVERFNASGKSIGKGLMKIYIKPVY